MIFFFTFDHSKLESIENTLDLFTKGCYFGFYLLFIGSYFDLKNS